MKIKTDADSNGVAVCNTWDGTNLGTEDINVRVFVSFKANQELWAKTVSPNAAVQKDAKDVFYIEDGTKQYQLNPGSLDANRRRIRHEQNRKMHVHVHRQGRNGHIHARHRRRTHRLGQRLVKPQAETYSGNKGQRIPGRRHVYSDLRR
jgi:hypothetical protein